jgi:hypothetical protein
MSSPSVSKYSSQKPPGGYRFRHMRQQVRDHVQPGGWVIEDVRISNGWNVIHFQYYIDY